MPFAEALKQKIRSGAYEKTLAALYPDGDLNFYGDRFCKAIDSFAEIFGERDGICLFSAPGRTEIGGNHTDHQHGHVLAASVNLDVIAVAALNGSNLIRIKSEGYEMDTIDIRDLSVKAEEYNHAAALIRGIASKIHEMGYELKGFDAYTTSNVLSGSGLSSSAAFEVLVGNMVNSFCCEGKISPVEIAKIGQYAENVFFGKPCGLMDQMASSVGGIVTIDFKDTSAPVVEKVDFDFEKSGFALCIIDSGADHADLTDEYASIPKEMKSAAKVFGKDFLRDVPKDEFYSKIADVRKAAGDRAVLRAIHFFDDDARVLKQVDAIKHGDFEGFLNLVTESGRSSFMYLQNIFSTKTPGQQDMSVLLALCEKLLSGKGAWRVHGGGFAGTVQAFVPRDMLDEFKASIEAVFGKGKCHVLSIRAVGGIKLPD